MDPSIIPSSQEKTGGIPTETGNTIDTTTSLSRGPSFRYTGNNVLVPPSRTPISSTKTIMVPSSSVGTSIPPPTAMLLRKTNSTASNNLPSLSSGSSSNKSNNIDVPATDIFVLIENAGYFGIAERTLWGTINNGATIPKYLWKEKDSIAIIGAQGYLSSIHYQNYYQSLYVTPLPSSSSFRSGTTGGILPTTTTTVTTNKSGTLVPPVDSKEFTLTPDRTETSTLPTPATTTVLSLPSQFIPLESTSINHHNPVVTSTILDQAIHRSTVVATTPPSSASTAFSSTILNRPSPTPSRYPVYPHDPGINLRFSPSTLIHYLYTGYRFVYAIDLSSSMFALDPHTTMLPFQEAMVCVTRMLQGLVQRLEYTAPHPQNNGKYKITYSPTLYLSIFAQPSVLNPAFSVPLPYTHTHTNCPFVTKSVPFLASPIFSSLFGGAVDVLNSNDNTNPSVSSSSSASFNPFVPYIILYNEELTRDNVNDIIRKVQFGLQQAAKQWALYQQYTQLLRKYCTCRRSSNSTSTTTGNNGVSSLGFSSTIGSRNSTYTPSLLPIIHSSIALLKLLPHYTAPSIFIATDGTSSVSNLSIGMYGSILTSLTKHDITISIIQLGSCGGVHSSLGNIPDTEGLQFLCSTTGGFRIRTRDTIKFSQAPSNVSDVVTDSINLPFLSSTSSSKSTNSFVPPPFSIHHWSPLQKAVFLRSSVLLPDPILTYSTSPAVPSSLSATESTATVRSEDSLGMNKVVLSPNDHELNSFHPFQRQESISSPLFHAVNDTNDPTKDQMNSNNPTTFHSNTTGFTTTEQQPPPSSKENNTVPLIRLSKLRSSSPPPLSKAATVFWNDIQNIRSGAIVDPSITNRMIDSTRNKNMVLGNQNTTASFITMINTLSSIIPLSLPNKELVLYDYQLHVYKLYGSRLWLTDPNGSILSSTSTDKGTGSIRNSSILSSPKLLTITTMHLVPGGADGIRTYFGLFEGSIYSPIPLVTSLSSSSSSLTLPNSSSSWSITNQANKAPFSTPASSGILNDINQLLGTIRKDTNESTYIALQSTRTSLISSSSASASSSSSISYASSLSSRSLLSSMSTESAYYPWSGPPPAIIMAKTQLAKYTLQSVSSRSLLDCRIKDGFRLLPPTASYLLMYLQTFPRTIDNPHMVTSISGAKDSTVHQRHKRRSNTKRSSVSPTAAVLPPVLPTTNSSSFSSSHRLPTKKKDYSDRERQAPKYTYLAYLWQPYVILLYTYEVLPNTSSSSSSSSSASSSNSTINISIDMIARHDFVQLFIAMETKNKFETEEKKKQQQTVMGSSNPSSTLNKRYPNNNVVRSHGSIPTGVALDKDNKDTLMRPLARLSNDAVEIDRVRTLGGYLQVLVQTDISLLHLCNQPRLEYTTTNTASKVHSNSNNNNEDDSFPYKPKYTVPFTTPLYSYIPFSSISLAAWHRWFDLERMEVYVPLTKPLFYSPPSSIPGTVYNPLLKNIEQILTCWCHAVLPDGKSLFRIPSKEKGNDLRKVTGIMEEDGSNSTTEEKSFLSSDPFSTSPGSSAPGVFIRFINGPETESIFTSSNVPIVSGNNENTNIPVIPSTVGVLNETIVSSSSGIHEKGGENPIGGTVDATAVPLNGKTSPIPVNETVSQILHSGGLQPFILVRAESLSAATGGTTPIMAEDNKHKSIIVIETMVVLHIAFFGCPPPVRVRILQTIQSLIEQYSSISVDNATTDLSLNSSSTLTHPIVSLHPLSRLLLPMDREPIILKKQNIGSVPQSVFLFNDNEDIADKQSLDTLLNNIQTPSLRKSTAITPSHNQSSAVSCCGGSIIPVSLLQSLYLPYSYERIISFDRPSSSLDDVTNVFFEQLFSSSLVSSVLSSSVFVREYLTPQSRKVQYMCRIPEEMTSDETTVTDVSYVLSLAEGTYNPSSDTSDGKKSTDTKTATTTDSEWKALVTLGRKMSMINKRSMHDNPKERKLSSMVEETLQIIWSLDVIDNDDDRRGGVRIRYQLYVPQTMNKNIGVRMSTLKDAINHELQEGMQRYERTVVG